MGLVDVAAARRRERQLAADARSGTFARAKARREQRDFLRRNWRLIACFACFVAVVATVICLLTPSDFMRGVTVGASVSAVPGVIWAWTVQVTGTAPTMMGDHAEQWTAQELRKGRRRGWRLVNHVLLHERGDIDHVLVGAAGVWVVETKWSASWDTENAAGIVRRAVAQATASARSLRLWAPIRKVGADAQPLVVLWGGGLTFTPESARMRTVDGVPVVAGVALTSWLASQDAEVLDRSAVDRVCAALDTQVRRRDGADRAANPLPTSFARYLGRAAEVAAGAYAALLAVPLAGSLAHSVATSAVAFVLLLAPGFLLRVPSLRVFRFAAWGWAAVTGLAIAAYLVFALYTVVR